MADYIPNLFMLVLFVDDEEKSVDIVPTKWLIYNEDDQRLYCLFIEEFS